MSSEKLPLVSLIIPCFNEEIGIENTYQVITEFWKKIENKYNLELVMIDDGSKDNTYSVLRTLAKMDSKIKLIQFSRNFGKEIATSCGIHYSKGDCCIMFDADLQYPIESITEFLDEWQKGYEVVIGIRDKKQTNNLIEKIGSYLFYKILHLISDLDFRSGALDFRLLDRRVIEEFNKFTERGRMTRALIDWLGFKRKYIFYTEKPRAKGVSNFSLSSRIRLAISTYISTSLFPLKIAGYLGLIISLFSGFLGLIISINKYLLNDVLQWSTSPISEIGILVLFLTGLNLVCLGIIALYIANIHGETSNKPLYVIRNKVNFDN